MKKLFVRLNRIDKLSINKGIYEFNLRTTFILKNGFTNQIKIKHIFKLHLFAFVLLCFNLLNNIIVN
jgi:hypothetical protein